MSDLDAVTDGGAGTDAPATPEKIFEGSEADYSRARSEHIKTHGVDSWNRFISEAATPPADGNDKPASKAEPGTEPAAQQEDGDFEPGEITIDEQGTARDKKTGQFVPKSAYLRVKGEAIEHKKTTETLREEVIRARERLAILTEAMGGDEGGAKGPGAKAAQEEAAIDPEQDIFGALKQALKKIETLEQSLSKTSTDTKAQFEARELRDYTLSDARSFSAKQPDFQAALMHAMTVQEKIKMTLGATPEEAKAAVKDDLHNLVERSRKSGKSWAENVYAIAKEYGYQSTAAEGESEAEKKGREEIERIRNGQNAAQTLRGAGSGGVGEQLTRDKVAMMTEDEYYSTRKSYIAKNGQAAWERMMNL